MKFEDAREFVAGRGVKIVLDPANGVNGVAIGQKDGGGLSAASEYCVTAFVTRKLTRDELQSQGVQPFDQAFQAAAGDSPNRKDDLDVVESGGGFEIQSPYDIPSPQRGKYGGMPPILNAQRSFTSLRCGIGITNPVGAYPTILSVGTAGFFMWDDQDNLYVVSNNHVIGGSNSAAPGDMVVQPGTLDLTALELVLMPNLALLSRTRIADLTAFVPLTFGTSLTGPINRVDAAIAQVDKAERSVDDIERLTFGGCIRGVAAPYQVDANGILRGSDRVYKVGRTTGYTEGNVTNLAFVGSITYPDGTAVFSDQMVVKATSDNVGPFSDDGDSGSGVLSDRHELVGLLFAGSPKRTLVNPIDSVVSELRKAANIPTLRVAQT